MKRTILIAAISPAALAFASCGSAQTGDNDAARSATSGNLVSEAQSIAEASSAFTIEEHGTLDEPWAIAVEPGTGKLFITEKRGTAKFYQPANGRLGTIESGLPQVAYGGQGGLGDFAFAPDYETSRTVYLSWADGAEGDARRAAVGRGTLVCEEHDSCRIEGFTKIWQQSLDITSPGHFSHKITFSPDGRHMFVASGERMQGDPAQDLGNTLGAIVRLNLDGTPVEGNPFADRGSPTDQIWSYGQRNIYGLEFDSQGRLWGLEHGPRGGDELNLVEPGNNYGWPVRSNGDNYNGDPIPDHTADDGFIKPAISWNPVIAPGGMTFYSGKLRPEWEGQLLVANLGSMSLSRIEAVDANTATELARYGMGARLRDIAETDDGAIWVIGDGPRGKLLKLTPKS
jgi:glucose/arabinose dehydrogenase